MVYNDLFNDMFQEGRTALLVACWRGFLPIVVMLIKSGANTDAQDQVHCIITTTCCILILPEC